MFAFAYLAAAWVSQRLAIEPERIAVIWLPTGLGVAVMLLCARRECPGFALAAFAANLVVDLLNGQALLPALGFAAITVLEIGLAAWILLRKVGQPFAFITVRDILWLCVVVFGLYPLTALLAAGWALLTLNTPFDLTWLFWWVSQIVGLLLVMPVVVVWSERRALEGLSRNERITLGLVFMLLVGLCLFIFTLKPEHSGFIVALPYVTYPLLFWITLRSGLYGATAASIILAVAALWGTGVHLGPFAVVGQEGIEQLFVAETFLIISILFSLTVAVVNRARQQAEEAQRTSEERLRSILSNAPALIGLVDRKGTVLFHNRNPEGDGEGSPIGGKLAQWVSCECQPAVLAAINRVFEKGEGQRLEMSGIMTGGKGDDWYDVSLAPLTNERGWLEHAILIAVEVTERKRAVQALRTSEERFALAASGANDGIWDWDLTNNTVYYSPRWKAMLGYGEAEISESPDEWLGRIHPDDLGQLKADLANHLAGRTPHFINEHRLMSKTGSYRWVLTRGLAVRNKTQAPHRLTGSLTDFTDRKMAEERLQHDAMHDLLTGLPNRAYLFDQLRRAIERTRRHGDYLSAVLFIDLDRFKIINESLGHDSGDQLLYATARRLEGCLRPEDTIARFGGDEFAVLLDNIQHSSQAAQVASRILEMLIQPFSIGGQDVFISASIGIALTSSNYERAEDMLRDVDTAMYQAKALGRNRYQMFDTEMHARSLARLRLEADLRRAIERKEFEVYYQPVIALPGNTITAFEALLRWRHPEQGILPPSEFLSVAEETGMILPVNEWVLRTACAQVKAWQVTINPELRIAVNISARMLQDDSLTQTVQHILAETGLPYTSLMLEITESDAMQDFAQTVRTLSQLKELGVSISLDDFGMRYSSLDYLKRFPVNTIKIDRSFIAEVTQNPENAAIARAIISVAHVLNKTVVAEGVEELTQAEFLNFHLCDEAQGYLYCRPQPAESITRLMQGGMCITPVEEQVA